MTAYYNENDPYAAQWLRNLISRGLVSPGDVDERSIADVSPSDLAGYVQCHFFAGIGVWSHALRTAGWRDDREVWTGSCPCQPFSAAGKGGGFDDERHLWPFWHHLIRVRRPATIFGEQVASKDGLGWLDLVHADLEGLGYACGPVPFPAAGIGAPHIRQRLYFVGHADDAGSQGRRIDWNGADECAARPAGLAHVLDHATDPRHDDAREHERGSPLRAARSVEPGPVSGFWADAEWIQCTDGKARPVEPGTSPLAHGAIARVGRLRAYGNAIVAAQATEFIKAAIAST